MQTELERSRSIRHAPRADWRATRARRRGFTTVELITVVVIIGIVSVSAIPIFTGNDEYRLHATAKKIASDIRYAQQLAMDNHGSYSIEFSTSTDAYTLYDLRSTKTPAKDPFTGSNFAVQLDADIYSGVTLTEAAFGLSNSIEFDKEGTPSSSGQIGISAGGMTLSITVLQTGLTRIASSVEFEEI